MSVSDNEAGVGVIEQITVKIKELIEANLETGRPYLLSKLGVDLGPNLKELKTLTKKPLAGFLSDTFAGEYSIFNTGQHNNIQAIARKALSLSEVALANDKTTSSVSKVVRYNHKFWSAFSIGLASDRRRFLNLTTFYFQDLKQEPSGFNFVEIEAEFIAPTDADNRDVIIASNIEKWLSKTGHAQDIFLAHPHQTNDRPAVGSRSVLEVVIEALDRRQLMNTNLSLDIVASLLRKRI